MKKYRLISVILLTTMLVGLLPSMPASAAEVYDLKIAGVQVTSANNNNVLGDGAFSYDPGTNTLTVRGDCDCSSKGVSVIINNISDLTIYVANDVTLKAGKTGNENLKEECAICTYVPMTVTGPGLLKLISDYIAFYGGGWQSGNGKKVTIDDARIDIKSKRIGMGYIGALILKSCYLHITADDCVVRCYNLQAIDCSCVLPKKGAYDSSTGHILGDDRYHGATEVLITQKYGIDICGTAVTRENKNDILGGGEASYDPETNVLTLKKSISSGGDVLRCYNPGLTVYVAKNITLNSGWNDKAIVAEKDLTITGPGKLKLRGGYYGIWASSYSVNVTLDRAYIDSYTQRGIDSASSYVGPADLTIRNSYVKSVSTETDSIHTSSAISMSIIFDGCDIVSPEGAYYEGWNIHNPNGGFCTDVTINGIYDLWIDGSQVAASNAYNITGAGEFAYDADENVLHVKESFTAHSGIDVITNGIPGLEIRAEKDVTLSSDSCAAVINADTTFTGDKTLYLNGADAGVFVREGAKLTVDNTALGISGGNGIMGISSADGASLFVNSSHVIATSTNIAAVFNLASITLNDCIIISPSGARISGGDILQSNGSYAKTVTISTPVTTVKTVNIAIPKPVAGNTVTYNSVTLNAEGYGIEYGYSNSTWSMGVIWKENNTTLDVNEAHTFVSGNKYTVTVSVVITDTERYKFAAVNELKAYINGKEAEVVKYTSTNYGIRYTFDLTPPQAVTDIYVTIPEPEAGDLIYYYAKVPEGCGYRVQTELNNGLLWESGVAWYCDGSSLCPQDDEYFVNGGDYRVEVSIVLTDEDRYEFGNMMDMYILVNGHYADYTKVSDTKIIVHYYFTVEAEPIDEILIYDFYKPAIGKKAGESENSMIYDSRFSITETKWYCDTDHRYMNSGDVFEAGKLYSHRWLLKATAGYVFDEDYVYAAINDETDLVDTENCGFGDSTSEYVIWTVPAEPVNQIGEVRINGYTAPTVGHTAGENLSSISVPGNANYRVTFISWIVSGEEKPMNAGDIFENGKEYYISFSIEPKDGYSFCGQMPEVYINGIREFVGSARLYEYDDVLDGTTVLASFGTVIEEITVLGFKVPETGQTVNEASASITAPAGAHYEFVYILWYEEYGNGKPLSGEYVFEAGKTYELYVIAAPEAGYRFISPSVIIEGGQKYFNKGVLDINGEYGIDLTGIEAAASSDIKYGDVNGDGAIDGKDLIRLRKYLDNYNSTTGQSTVEINSANADCTGDGKVDGKDLIRLRKYLDNYNSSTGQSTIHLGP